MSAQSGKHTTGLLPNCVMDAVMEVFASEPQLEVVTLDREGGMISVATLGKTSDPEITDRISERVRAMETGDGPCVLLRGVGDCLTCEHSVRLDTKQFKFSHEDGKTTIARVTCPTAPAFWHWWKIPWPAFVPRELEIEHELEHADEWKPQLAAAGLCALAGLAGAYYFQNGPAQLAAFAVAYLAGGWFAALETWELFRDGKLDVHFLMLAVAVGGACIGAYAEGATLLFLFSFSGALEHYAMGRTQREIHSLFKEAPKVAWQLDAEGRETETPIAQIRPGMRLRVKPHAQFPVDAEIVGGVTAADESSMTGEAAPVEKARGDRVLAGTMNLWGAVEVCVLRAASESSLQRIIRLIRDAQHLKAPSQRFTDRFGSAYTYAILLASLTMFLVWWLGFHLAPLTGSAGHPSAFYRAMVLLVVGSPCALVLSIPSAILASIAWGARRGILFRGGAAVEKLASVNVVALDKTGTLTTGDLKVEQIESFPTGREAEVLRLAYSVEKLSEHPLARAIALHGRKTGIEATDLKSVSSAPGAGVTSEWEGKQILLGKRAWVEHANPAIVNLNIPTSGGGASEVWLSWGDLTGRILLRDEIRPEAKSVLEALRKAGITSIVLTGDRVESAAALRDTLAPDEVRAGLTPEAKVAAIRKLTLEGKRVAMIGDGVNDAPSLAASYVGVAMGARGSDAALEQAEVVLMHDRLENFWAAYKLSGRAQTIIQQNLVISLGTVAVLVGLALWGVIPLTVGVVGHEGSTVVVVMNSLRLLFTRKSID